MPRRPRQNNEGWPLQFPGAVLALSLVVLAASFAIALTPATTLAADGTTNPSLPALDATATPDTSGTVEASGTTPTASPTQTVGYSVQGRRIVLERFGSGPRHVLIVGGVHGNEAGGPVAAKFATYLRTHPWAIAPGTQVDVIAYVSPDGRALKRRTNARKVDLNRNFPASNWTRKRARHTASHGAYAGSEPETRALMQVLAAGHYVRVISLHSRGGIVDFDGHGSLKLAKRIARAAHIRVVRLPAYRGSMGSYVPEKLHIPIVTWELSSRKLTKRVRAGLLVSLK